MSKDSFFSMAESLMGQIMAILEKKYGMDIPEAYLPAFCSIYRDRQKREPDSAGNG